MNISFYTAAVGVEQQQARLNVHGNNIANVNNYGFRARRPAFQALIKSDIRGIDDDLPRGVGSLLAMAEPDFESAGYKGTDLALDYAIEGDGFFALEDPSTGEISYTRDGSFVRAQNEIGEWCLTDGLGQYVLDPGGARIVVEEEDVKMGHMLSIGIFDFENYDGMLHVGDNRVMPVEKNGAVQAGNGTLIQGYLEVSNTDLAREMSKVIESQRAFSYMLRMVQTSDEIETTVNGLR